MTAKAEVLEVVTKMPDDVSFDDIATRIEFMAKVKKGMAQAQRGEGTPIEEVMQEIPKWISR